MPYSEQIHASTPTGLSGAMPKDKKKEDINRERLIVARNALGLTQVEMAAQLLTPLSTYEQWEAGRFRVPGVAALAAELLCEAEGHPVPKKRPVGKHAH